jgi:hypothetical protein
MRRLYWFVTSLLLGTALVAPMGLNAAPLDDRHQYREDQRRYYDRDHRENHVWNSREANAYRRWQHERNERRDFARLNRREQSEYWNWRRGHPDHDRDRH